MSKYYDPNDKVVFDGDTAEASDVNDVNTSTAAGFDLVEADINAVGGLAEAWAEVAKAWAIAETQPEPGYESSRTYALEAYQYAQDAEQSANDAAVIEGNVVNSEANAANCAAEAYDSAQSAASSASIANSHRIAAESAAADAEAAKDQTIQYRDQSEQYKTEAYNWAQYPANQPVPSGSGSEYSAYHWAQIAAGGGITSIQGVLPIQVDNTNPTNPVISFVGESTDNKAVWGNITGDITNQTDLQTALGAKEDSLGTPTTDGDALVSTVAGVRSWAPKLTSVQEGNGILIDATDPLNPILSVEKGEGGLVWQTGPPAGDPLPGVGYGLNTLGGPISIQLPDTFEQGVPVGFMDLFSAFDVNSLTLLRGAGQSIMGAAENMTVTTKNTSVVLALLGVDWRVVSVTPQDSEGGGAPAPALVSHIQIYVPASAIAAGAPISIGNAPAGFNVQATQVDVQTAFDGGASLTVGTDTDPTELLEAAFVEMGVLGAYGKANNLSYAGTPEYKIFPSGSPTVGMARVTIYFN